MDTTIRTAEEGDREAVFALARKLAVSFEIDAERFSQSWNEIIASTDACLYVAETSGAIVGYVLGFSHPTFYANGPVGWIEEILVVESERRKGFGRELIRKFEDWAKNKGCRLVALATRRAPEFYRALGYEESATYFRKLL